MPWHVEFYNEEAYWEAWFFSSGTLTSAKAYTVDAWGIGGGAGTNRVDAYSTPAAGTPNMITGIQCDAGQIVVTIGAGANATTNGNDTGVISGGTTSFKSLSCAGGARTSDCNANQDMRNRFGDTTKNEYGQGGTTSGNGWLNITLGGATYAAAQRGKGFGAGCKGYSTSGAYGAPGALVIRIKI